MPNIIDVRSKNKVPKWGNEKKFIAIHYLGVTGENYELSNDGCGAHYTIYKNGTIYNRCDHDAIVWQIGTAGYYTQKHPTARNANTIGIEMCCNCDGNSKNAEDPKWWFTTETQEACVWLVKKLMKELNIPVENVIRHYDAVNKTCPAPYVHNNNYRTSWTWDEFKAKLTENSQNGVVEQTSTIAITSLNGLSEAQKVAKIAPLYQQVMKETGMLASVGLAQFCLESGYGTTDLAQNANNLHGMKASLSGNSWSGSVWDGTSTYSKKTKEQDKYGNEYTVWAKFRKYPTLIDSIRDRAAYFKGAMNGANLRYPGISTIRDALTQIKLIKSGGYATDVKYVDKLWNIVQRFNLTQYDNVEVSKENAMTILDAAEEIRKEVEKGGWKYANSKQASTFDKAIKENKKNINCALGVLWALKMIKDLGTSDSFWGNKGKIQWKAATKAKLEKNGYKIIHVDGKKTVQKAIKAGYLKAGDIVMYQNLVHTNLYAGGGKWYDFGHGYSGNSGEFVPLTKVYGKTLYGDQPISYIIRKESATKTEPEKTTMYRVQLGLFVKKGNANNLVDRVLKKTGFACFIEESKDGWVVICGSYAKKSLAEERVALMKKNGFAAIIKETKK